MGVRMQPSFLTTYPLSFSVVSSPGCSGPRLFVVARPPLLFFLVAPLSGGSRPSLPFGLCTVWLGFFSCLWQRPFVWYVRCVLGLCPPLPGGCSWCCAESRILLFAAAVRCGQFCVGPGVFVCCAVVLCGCLAVCCAVVLCCWFCPLRLRLALVAPFLLLLCGSLLCGRVLRGISPCVVLWCVVVCCGASLVLGGVKVPRVVCSFGPLRRAALCSLCRVVLHCPAPPLLLLSSGLLLLAVPLWLPIVVLLSWGPVLCCSVVPLVVHCADVFVVSCCVVLRFLVDVGWCRVLLPIVSKCLVLGLFV